MSWKLSRHPSSLVRRLGVTKVGALAPPLPPRGHLPSCQLPLLHSNRPPFRSRSSLSSTAAATPTSRPRVPRATLPFSQPRPRAAKLGALGSSSPASGSRAFSQVSAMGSPAQTPDGKDARPVLFFDIDNCLYPRSAKVHDQMVGLIDRYFATHLGLPADEAVRLHREYYQGYGLAIEGLVRHHQIDPLEYNARVDDALPLEAILRPDPRLRRLLEDVDRQKVRLWLFTNAYVNHGRRVVRLLGVEDLFEGLTYCDYSSVPFVCKPQKEMFAKAMQEAGVTRNEDCYFVDDTYLNCKGAQELGWTAVHLVEEGVQAPDAPASQYRIKQLEELRTIFPQFFKTS